MRILVGSDDSGAAVDAVIDRLRQRGHDVETLGASAGEPGRGLTSLESVARDVARSAAEQAVLFCWTGTGVSKAANKVRGVRAALRPHGETARGARA